MTPERILVVRLGAMGDILHAMPAAAALKTAYPGARLAWAVQPRWRELLEDGGLVDELIVVDRRSYTGVRSSAAALRSAQFDFAVDFQGLLQSALVAKLSHARRVYGFHRRQARESAAALFYSDPVETTGIHVVDKNLDIAQAAGAQERTARFFIPPGRAESPLPDGRFVLAAPFAGWASKQWPLENYAVLAGRLRQQLGVTLVLNGAPRQMEELRGVPNAWAHSGSVAGLIDATRQAAAIVGVDSGPMHLAAALGKPGVALFGPTDPARNGPYQSALTVLRAERAETTYTRGASIHASMRQIDPATVFNELARIFEHAVLPQSLR